MAECITKTAAVSGMVCAACAARIGKRLSTEPGVREAKADYGKGTLRVTFDSERVPWTRLAEILDGMDYALGDPDAPAAGGAWRTLRQIAGTLAVCGVLYWVGVHFGLLTYLNIFPEAESGMGLGMIFAVGLLTSGHCLAMCGGINLSQAALSHAATTAAVSGGRAAARPVLLYGMGRVISYTAIGAVVGGLGGVFSLSSGSKGLIQIIAGVFMLLMGLNLMGIFPWIRRLIPRLPQSLSRKVSGGAGRGPLYVGLLNGFMPCGPLQTMQFFALSTGSPVEGALAMFAFAVGTLPLTMGLGMVASYLGRRFMGTAIRVGAVLVFLMGLAMLGNGLTLSGVVRPSFSDGGDVVASKYLDGRQVLETELQPDWYPAIRVYAGVPVRWRITAPAENINGCNNRFFIPEYGIEHKLTPGENIIEFTPTIPGVYPYMCWMGMIASRIVVGDVEDTGATPMFDPSMLPDSGEVADDIPWLE